MSSALSKTIRSFGMAIPLFSGLLLPSGASADVKTFTVSTRVGQGTHTDIQKAINDCTPNDVCTINLVDSSYTLTRPIWIEGKRNLTVVGTRTGTKPVIQFATSLLTKVANPNNGKGGTPPAQVARLFTLPFLDPVTGVADPKRPAGWLMWPFKGRPANDNVPLATADPGNTNDTTTGYSSSGFQYNGMFVVHKSQDVTIRSLKLVSQPTFFQNQGVWSQKYDVLFGNVGVNLIQSLRGKVQDCEITGFFSGFYIQGRNVGGAFGRANVNDLDEKDIVPLSRYGQMGDHLIERNYVNNNWWFVYDEIDWDLGSTIRFNVAFQNMNKSFQYGDTLTDKGAATDEMNNMTGGFFYGKDGVIVPHRIYNNTILSSPVVIGHGGWRRNAQAMFYNNVISFYNLKDKTGALIVGPKDQHNLLRKYGEMVWNNTIQLVPGMEKVTTKQTGSWPITDTAVHIQYSGSATYQTCGGGCYVNGVKLLEPYISELQPNQLFDTWGIQQGTYVRIAGDSVDWTKVAANATITGYEGKTYSVWENNGYSLWGLFNKLPGLDTASARLRQNLWAMKIPTKGVVDSTTTKVASINDLAPKWGDPVVNSTIRNKAWKNTDLGGPDGGVSDRGAFQYDSVAGRTVLGGIRNGVQLEVVDQRIVTMKGTRVNLPFIVQQINGDVQVSNYYTDIRVDSVYYYKAFPFSSVAAPDDLDSTFSHADVVKTGFKWSGTNGDSLAFTVPAAAVADYARFDIFVSAIDPVSGERVRTVANYVYRKAAYRLLVDFCTDAANCATTLVKKTRVGETVNMRIRLVDANDALVSQPVTKLMVTPGPGNKMVDATTGNTLDTNVFKASFTGSTIAPVWFESMGQNDVGAAGIFGSLGVMGSGSITVMAGPPYRVQWVTPPSTKVVPCVPKPDLVSGALDTTIFCTEIPASGLTAADLRVYDKYGNQITEAAKVKITGSNLANPLVARGTAKVAGTVGGALADSVVVTTDTTGKASVWITGTPSAIGTYPKGWVQFLARVDSVNLPTDTTRARLGAPAARLVWVKPVKIDTTIRTSVPVKLMVTKDSVPDVAFATATVRVYPSQSRSIVFYKDAARTQPITDSTVQLVGGEITLWIASDVATTVNKLIANLPSLPGSPEYDDVRFYVPPPPPSPVPDSAAFYDRDCDGKADVVRLWLKGTATSTAVMDTTKVKPELLIVTYADGTKDSVVAGGWTLLPGATSLDLALAHAPATTAPVGDVQMIVRLRRPPADDTLIVAGTKVSVVDRVAPRPTSGAIVENFSPGTLADTVRVSFSEPVVFTGTAWPFLTREVPAGTIVNTSAISVAPIAGAAAKSLVFVITGNTGGTIVHAGQSIAIDSTAFLVDASGNHGKGGECLGDTAILQLVPQPVPMVSSSIQDANGDGSAELVRVEFRRKLRVQDVPDSLVVSWGGLSTSVSLTGAVTTDSTTWFVGLAKPFPKGLTQGSKLDGSGDLTLRAGAGATARTQTISMADSVAPIPVAATLSYGAVGAKDTLYVSYSEPTRAVAGTSWMLDQRLADAPVSVLTGTPVGTDGLKWAFTVDPSSANYPRPGDSVRLPSGTASNLVDARGILPTSPTSPYVEVVGDPIKLYRSALRDRDGDGSADQLSLEFLRPLRRADFPDSLRIVWAGESRLVTLAGASTTDSTSWIVDLATPFAKGRTAGGNADGSGTTTLRKGARSEPVGLADSVPPIPLGAELRYGKGGAQDTLVVAYSEVLARKAGSAWMLDQRLADAPASILSGAANATDASRWNFLVDPAGTVYPRPGDSVRLPSGSASNLSDARGILPASPTSPYVVVVGPPIPMVGSFLKDTDGDGRADRVTVTFLKPLQAIDIPDSLRLAWGGESRLVTFAGASTSDSTTWTISVAQPFSKGITAGGAADGSGTTFLNKVVGGVSRPDQTALTDSVAPIPVSASLRYGASGGLDTLWVTYSEDLVARAGSAWMLNQRGGDVAVPVASGSATAGDSRTWALLVDAARPGFARAGDSIRLPGGAASSLADARGVLPTSPLSPYVKVLGGDRPPVRAWYRDVDGDGRVDLAVLEFADTLASNPSYVLNWAGESRSVDSSAYGGIGAGRVRLEVVLSNPFSFGLTSSTPAASYGVQTSATAGAQPSTASFPIQDSVPPVILRGHVGWSAYNEANSRDTLYLKLSEPVTANGFTVVLGRGEDQGAYPIGFGHSGVVGLLQPSGDSLIFLCDTSCVEGPSAAGMPNNGDSVRLSMPQGGILVQDLFGNAPGVDAKWTRITAGDRPYNYVVNIFPKGILNESQDDFVPNPSIKSKPALSVWILKDGKWLEFKDGQLTGESYASGAPGAPGPIEQNGVGLKIEINSAFQSSVLLYDNIGTYVGNADIAIDSAMAKAFGNSAGKFSILIYFNGRKDSDASKVVASGVYLIRYLTFRDELQPNGGRQRKLIENKVFKIGMKSKNK